jgi:hypothetical protein
VAVPDRRPDRLRPGERPEAVIARLVDMASASSTLVYEVPDTVWAFAKAAGMTDELTVREQEREAKHRAAIEDPNGLFQIMRRKHEEKMLSVQNPSVE